MYDEARRCGEDGTSCGLARADVEGAIGRSGGLWYHGPGSCKLGREENARDGREMTVMKLAWRGGKKILFPSVSGLGFAMWEQKGLGSPQRRVRENV